MIAGRRGRRTQPLVACGVLALLLYFLFSQAALSIHLLSEPHLVAAGIPFPSQVHRHPQPTSRPSTPLPAHHHTPHSAGDHEVFLLAFALAPLPALPVIATAVRVEKPEPAETLHAAETFLPRSRGPPATIPAGV